MSGMGGESYDDGDMMRRVDVSDCDDEFHMGADFSGRLTCRYCGSAWQSKPMTHSTATKDEGK